MIPPPPKSTLFPYTTLFRSTSPPEWSSWRRTRMCPSEPMRLEEHTSELQSRGQLVCRLLLEKKNELFMRSPCNYNSYLIKVYRLSLHNQIRRPNYCYYYV